MAVLKNRAKMSTSTTGTGTITLGSAESGYQSFADAGVANADVVRYVIEDTGGAFEIGTGTYTSSGTTLSRTVSESSNSDAAINLSGSATVFIGATAADIELSGNMAGDISSNGHEIKFADSGAADQDRLTFGASDDLQIYHDGSNSYIVEGGTGDLRLQAANLAIQNTFGQYMIEANNGGGVNLYHNTTLKAQTETAGFAVRGQLVVRDSGGGVEYRLPAADGTNGQVLTTDGSGAVTFADAGGGGGADLYAANESSPSAQPSATGANSVAIGDGAISSGSRSLAGASSRATGTDAVALGIANNGVFYGAQANYAVAIGQLASAAVTQSTALGHYSHAGNTHAVAIGRARSTGTDSLAAVISTNSISYGASSANSIAMGRQSKAGNINSVSIGSFASATGDSSYALGYQATAESWNSVCIGANSKADRTGKIAFAAGIFAVTGDAQGGQFILRRLTTDATPKTLSTTGGNGGASNQIVANADTAITFDGTITALQNGAQAYASWKIEGLLVNDGGTTTLANSATTVIQNSSGWGMALSADNTNNALAITCTGEAAHNIRWVANIRTTECTYA